MADPPRIEAIDEVFWNTGPLGQTAGRQPFACSSLRLPSRRKYVRKWLFSSYRTPVQHNQFIAPIGTFVKLSGDSERTDVSLKVAYENNFATDTSISLYTRYNAVTVFWAISLDRRQSWRLLSHGKEIGNSRKVSSVDRSSQTLSPFRCTSSDGEGIGMNPKKFGKIANEKQEPWKMPLPDFHRRDLLQALRTKTT